MTRKSVGKPLVFLINLFWKAFLVLGTLIKVIKEGTFFCPQSNLPVTVDNQTITLHEYSSQKVASNCGFRPQ